MAVQFGYKLMTEEHGSAALIANSKLAEEAGFDFVPISDHFHPWLESQGHAPFAWSVLGGIATATSKIGIATGLTCPLIRYHPAIIAQAAATVAIMSKGRFTLAVGAGEALNEHVVGERWPSIPERHEMLEEAIDIFHTLWQGGVHSWQGAYYTLNHARLYDLPDEPVPVVVGVSGPASVKLAAERADGIMATEAKAELVDGFKQAGGSGPAYAEAVLSYAPSEEEGLRQAHETFRFSALGWAVNSELPTVEGFEAATKTVRPEDLKESIAAGPDVEMHLAAIRKYTDAGFDRIVLTCPGQEQERFIRFFEKELRPRL